MRDDGVCLNEDKYLLTSLTKACRLKNDCVKTRLPIQLGVLEVLLKYIRQYFVSQPYLEKLFSAIFSTAYFGLLRIGEVSQSEHVVLARNVKIADNKQKIMMILRSSKTHGAESKPQIIKITGNYEIEEYPRLQHLHPICSFKILRNYLSVRPISLNLKEQFFVFTDNSPVKPANVRKTLKIMLTLAGLDTSLYGMHSLRIERASDLLKLQYSVETIKKIGRWKSNAIYTYLRN